MKHETGLQFAAYRTKMSAIKYKFDFEIGHLVKSPCKECDQRIEYDGLIYSSVKGDRTHMFSSSYEKM